MEHYKHFNFDTYYNTIKTNKGIEYINLPCGFDIETSSVYVDERKAAFMYIWMIGIDHNKGVFYGRTYSDMLEMFKVLQSTFDLHEKRLLPLYIHNLGYEFQFLRKYLNWIDVFSVDERKPIRAICDYGIELRDSYILSGYSLANTAKNLNKHEIRKLEGDLDYTLTRHHETPLTDDEMSYCENDVSIVTAYIDEQIDQYKDVSKIPMTNTGRVRKFVKDKCFHSNTNHRKESKGKFTRYRNIMSDLTLDKTTYLQLKRGFMGGFTHASNRYSGYPLEEVTSIDITSSYPTVMVSEMFPMSRPKKLQPESLQHLKKLFNKYCIIFDVRFTNINNDFGYESYISESKCRNIRKPIIDNGRVFKAEQLETTITDIDFNIIERIYSWEKIEVTNVTGFVKGLLPKPIIESILELYKSKTELKGIEGKETEYLLSKGMLNSVYGMSVTDIMHKRFLYDNNQLWHEQPLDFTEEITNYNESRNRFLYYPWGVWVTAYARRNVWKIIDAIKNDYIYCDTDSIKMFNFENNKKIVSKYNDNILMKLKRNVESIGLSVDDMSPMNIHGESKPLGIWEIDGYYSHFKTLGAKRYIYKDDDWQMVVAGLSKQNGMKYLQRGCNTDHEVMQVFTDSLYVPASETGKMTHTYIDESDTFAIKDYKGKHVIINSKSSIHLEPCEFTLSVSSEYALFLNQMKNGYIYEGVKNV